MTAPADTLMGRLLARAAEGDAQAAEDFEELRAFCAAITERSRELGRRHALALIGRPLRRPTTEENETDA